MTYAVRPAEFHAAQPVQPRRRGFWSAMLDAVTTAHQRQAQRDVERLVSWRNGIFNDNLEREIESRMFRGDWNFPNNG